jgi:hypothetical protein
VWAPLALVTLILLLLFGRQRRVAISTFHHLIVNLVIFKPIIVFLPFIGAISINLSLFTAKQIGEMIGIIHITRSECRRLNKTIFVYIGVGFKTIGTFTPAIRPLLYVPVRFGVLNVITVFVFVWAVALCLNDTSINNTDFASTNVQPLNAQLTVDFRQ